MTPVKGSDHKAMAVDVEEPDHPVHTVVIDGSSFTFIDSMGLQVLPSVSILTLWLPFQKAFFLGTVKSKIGSKWEGRNSGVLSSSPVPPNYCLISS